MNPNFPTLHKFCNGNLNKFFLLLRKDVYLYEYTIPPKEMMKIQYHPKKLFTPN